MFFLVNFIDYHWIRFRNYLYPRDTIYTEHRSVIYGTDDEWVEVGEEYGMGELTYQNKYASHVFKTADGYVYDIYGYVFIENSCALTGRRYPVTYTSSLSQRKVSFPYYPRSYYINIRSLDYVLFRIYKFFGWEYI